MPETNLKLTTDVLAEELAGAGEGCVALRVSGHYPLNWTLTCWVLFASFLCAFGPPRIKAPLG